MELRYSLVHGEKQKNQIVRWKAFADTVRIESADVKNKFLLMSFAAFRSSMMWGKATDSQNRSPSRLPVSLVYNILQEGKFPCEIRTKILAVSCAISAGIPAGSRQNSCQEAKFPVAKISLGSCHESHHDSHWEAKKLSEQNLAGIVPCISLKSTNPSSESCPDPLGGNLANLPSRKRWWESWHNFSRSASKFFSRHRCWNEG